MNPKKSAKIVTRAAATPLRKNQEALEKMESGFNYM